MARHPVYRKGPTIRGKTYPRLGRPHVPRLEKRSKQIVVRLNPLQFDFLQNEAATDEEMTVSDVIRSLVDAAMTRRRHKKGK